MFAHSRHRNIVYRQVRPPLLFRRQHQRKALPNTTLHDRPLHEEKKMFPMLRTNPLHTTLHGRDLGSDGVGRKRKEISSKKGGERKESKVFRLPFCLGGGGRDIKTVSMAEETKDRRGGGEEPLVLTKVYFLSTLLCSLSLSLPKEQLPSEYDVGLPFPGALLSFLLWVLFSSAELSYNSSFYRRDGGQTMRFCSPSSSFLCGWASFSSFFLLLSSNSCVVVLSCSVHESNTI